MRTVHLFGLLLCIILLLPAAACPTESDRQLNHQNREAGGMIAARATDPTIAQAGADVRDNSSTLAKNLIGVPKEPKPYSPEVSAEARQQSDKDHTTPWWQWLLGGVLSFVAGGGALTLIGRIFPMFMAGTAGQIVTVLLEGITLARKKAIEAPDGKIAVGDLVTILYELQKREGTQELVADLVKRVEKKLGVVLPKVVPDA